MDQSEDQYALVAPLTFTGTTSAGFTYSFRNTQLAIGSVVLVPLGRRQSLGVVTDVVTVKPSFVTKSIAEVLDIPPLPRHIVALAGWMGEFYFASPKAVWQTLLPAGITKKRRAKVPESTFSLPRQNQPLTPDQERAVTTITGLTQAGATQTALLHGVTGAGKTRVYIELAARQIADGKSVIILLPEIALTPQLIALFEASFAGRVVPYHSGLSEADKHKAWQRALESDEPLVVVGARSGLFLPLRRPGLIVIDEAHESTYKQEQNPRYHTSTVAAKLATLTGASLVLGSATPSLTDMNAARAGRITLVELKQRVPGRSLPRSEIIDLRDPTIRGKNAFLSVPLVTAVAATLAAGRQSLLFINRRGTASSQICDTCGVVTNCPTCILPLTFHGDTMKLVCHVCNFQRTPAAICAECNHATLRYLGGGTKRIETEIAKLFPGAKLARLDKDSADAKTLPQLYEKLHNGEIDILIGTQMIAKGLDLPKLDTVGVVNADGLLHMPDFSSAERTFQLLTQVAGRAGRGDAPGTVYIQTRTPDHPVIRAAAKHDYWAFAEPEFEQRKLLGYPPYRFLLKLTVTHKQEPRAIAAATEMTEHLRAMAGVRILGPAPAFHARAGGSYHWQLVVKAARRSILVDIARSLPSNWKTDLDPANLL